MIGSASLTSCFKDEPLNAECDIEQAYIHVDDPLEMFFQKSDTLISVLSTAEDINFVVRKSTDLTSLAPQFRLTPGATIYPDNGSEQDFSNGPIEYTVTSEDKQYRRTYRINFMSSKDIMEYNFDHFFLNQTPAPANKYYVWSDIDSEGNLLNNWGNGNPGFRFAKGSATPEEYPTVPANEQGHETCVKLTTSDTGDFGRKMKMPIAAGNLFLGEFDVSKALVANSAGVKECWLQDSVCLSVPNQYLSVVSTNTSVAMYLLIRTEQNKTSKTSAPSMQYSTIITTQKESLLFFMETMFCQANKLYL